MDFNINYLFFFFFFFSQVLLKAHERTIETDMLMALLKKIQRCRKDLKVTPSLHLNLAQLTCMADPHDVSDDRCEVISKLLQGNKA